MLEQRMRTQLGYKKIYKTMMLVFTIFLVLFQAKVAISRCTLDSLNLESLLPDSLARVSRSKEQPQVNVLESNIVCLSGAVTYGTYRYASVVVRYNCMGSGCPAGIAFEVCILSSPLSLGDYKLSTTRLPAYFFFIINNHHSM